jgi:hypothetical protein
MYEATRCALCSRGSEEHKELEERGEINHRFSESGNLEQIDRSTPRKQQARPTAAVIGAIDIDLRRILLKKGIITNADFAALYDPGAGASGDRETGEAPSSG